MWLGAERAPCAPKIKKKEQEVLVSHQLSAPTYDLALGKKVQEATVPKTQGHLGVKNLKPYICSEVHKRLYK